MAVWQLALNRRTRLLAVMVWSAACLAWLLGPEFIISFGPVAGGISDVGKFEYRVCEIICFAVFQAIAAYMLLGFRQRDAVDSPHYKPLIQNSLAGAAYAEPMGTIIYANPAFLRLFDLSQAVLGQISLQDILRGWTYPSPPGGLFPTAGRIELRARSAPAQGRGPEVLITISPAGDELEGFLLTALDVTELGRLQQVEFLLEGAIEDLPHGLVICDASRAGMPIVFANKAAQFLNGFSLDEMVGMPWTALQGPDRNQPGIIQLRTALEQKQRAVASMLCYRKDGSCFDCTVQLLPLMDANGRITHVVYLQGDVTLEVEATKARNLDLYHDDISGLLNRAGFVRGLTDMLAQPAERSFLLAKADIQKFHEFNTALGWDVGDALLGEAARRLAQALPSATLGRLESNQYGIALPVSPSDVGSTLDAIRQSVAGQYKLQGVTCEPVVSIGYTVVAGGSGTRAVLQQASVALNEARESGGGEVRQFDRGTETRITERRRLTAELRQAVQDRNFAVHYQPKVDLSNGMIIGAEALVRWYHPLFGVQQPSGFITLAEETGLILDIGEAVLREAVRFAATLNRGRRASIPIAINVSPLQLMRTDFATIVEQVLEDAGALAAWIQLELTETRYVSASPETLAILNRLNAMGVGLGIDDFGTGFSSLSYLTRFPVSEIKIDRCFIRGAEHSTVDRSVIKAIVNIGAAKGARVVAEGVEGETEHEMLLDLGCTMGQGFLFSRPLPAPEFQALVALGMSLPLSKARGTATAGPHLLAADIRASDGQT